MPRPLFIVAGAVALAALIGGVTATLLMGGETRDPAQSPDAPAGEERNAEAEMPVNSEAAILEDEAEAVSPAPNADAPAVNDDDYWPGTDNQAATTEDDGAPLAAEPLEDGWIPEPDENGVTTITWDHLLPEGEMERIETLYRAAMSMNEMNHFGGPMPQIGTFNVEERLIGRTIRMPGFILPLDLQPEGDITEFLLVPYFGACVHTPPPPPNQIVYVTSDAPVIVEELWAPVWVTGILSGDAHDNDLGDAAYTLTLMSHEPYVWER